MGAARRFPCTRQAPVLAVWRLAAIMMLTSYRASSAGAVLTRSTPSCRSRSSLPSTLSSAGVRFRSTSSTSTMSLRNSYRSRSGPGKPSRRARGGCGGTPGGGTSRHGSRSGYGMRAKGRRSAFGEERSGANSGEQMPLGFWDAGDVIWGSRGGYGGGSGGRQGGGRRRGDAAKQYHTNRAGGTFSAKASTSGNLLGAPPEWNYKKVDLSLLPRGIAGERKPKVNGGGRRRSALASGVAVEEFAPPTSGKSRGRGAKRSLVYSGLAAYNAHFASLVVMELKHEKEKAYERMTSWTQRELSSGGYTVQGLVGARVGRLYREHVIRFSLPPRKKDNKGKGNPVRRPPMPYHRFTAGDVVAITPGKAPPTQSEMDSGAVHDGVVLQRMPHFIDVVVKVVPEGLAEATPSGRIILGGSTTTFRLDQFVNGVSYDRMLQALQTATAPETLSVCPVVRGLVVDSLFPTLDRIAEVEKAGGLQPGIGDKALPPGILAPDAEWARIALGLNKAQRPESSRGHVAQVVAEVAADTGLSKRQAQAVRQALESRLTLIQGPPGTGKTKTACSLIQSAVRLRKSAGGQREGKVMATAFSNVAADNLLEGVLQLGMKAVRIGRPATVRPALWHSTLEAMIESHPAVIAAKGYLKTEPGEKDGAHRIKATEKPSTSSSPSRQALAMLEAAQERAAKDILKDVDVVVCSCIGAGNEVFVRAIGGDQESGFSSVRFSTVLIDEATQATEAAALVPLIRGCQQLILVGDQNQLPPTVICREAEDGGFGTSMFARLMHAGIKPILLDKQYRMHPAIAEFPSFHFYDGQVASGTRPADRASPRGFPWPAAATPVAFVRVCDDASRGQADGAGAGRGHLESRGGTEVSVQGGSSGTAARGTSYCNRREAEAVARALELIVDGDDIDAGDIGVISPYSAQVRLLQDVVASSVRSRVLRSAGARTQAGGSELYSDDSGSNGGSEEGGSGEEQGRRSRRKATGGIAMPEIASVDGYQGREKEVIILSAVRSNSAGRVGFLADWRRLNVAITRARRGVVVVGDPRTLSKDPHWRAFLRWCERRGVLMSEGDLLDSRPTGIERSASPSEDGVDEGRQ